MAERYKQDNTRIHLFITRFSFLYTLSMKDLAIDTNFIFQGGAMLFRLDHFFKELFSFTKLYTHVANWVFLLKSAKKRLCVKTKWDSVGEEFNSAKGF